jgi:NTP pyrophosphatase (non-canonical NTP hydrolase)
MIQPNNKITTEEAEICNILLEENAEVIQAISKIFRFGWDSTHPRNPSYTNKQHLTDELGDLICMVQLLVEKNILDGDAILFAAKIKLEKLARYSNIELS